MTKYLVTTLEHWRMRVKYYLDADTPEEALAKAESGNVDFYDADNLGADVIEEVVEVVEE